MEKKLARNYKVVKSPTCWVLKKKHVVKSGKREGEVDWRAEKFYGKISHACEGLMEYIAIEAPDEEATIVDQLRQILEAVENAKAEILQTLKDQGLE